MRASSGDEWDAEDEPPHPKNNSYLFGDENAKYARPERSMTSDSVELTVPSLPYDPAPSIPPVSPGILDSPPHDDTVSISDDHDHTSRDERHFSVQSIDSHTSGTTVLSMQKFESGTKFKEALDF